MGEETIYSTTLPEPAQRAPENNLHEDVEKYIMFKMLCDANDRICRTWNTYKLLLGRTLSVWSTLVVTAIFMGVSVFLMVGILWECSDSPNGCGEYAKTVSIVAIIFTGLSFFWAILSILLVGAIWMHLKEYECKCPYPQYELEEFDQVDFSQLN